MSGQLPSAEGTYYFGTAKSGAWKTLAQASTGESIYAQLALGQAGSQFPQADPGKPAGVSVAVGDVNGDGRARTPGGTDIRATISQSGGTLATERALREQRGGLSENDSPLRKG